MVYPMSAKPKWRSHVAAALCFLFFLSAISALAKKKAPDRPIDLNVANEKELEELPGVGPTTAKAIVDFRAKSGPFKRVEDLLVIRGISEAKLHKMRPYVVVGPAQKSTSPQPTHPAAPPPKKPANSPTPSS
jgi:competence ComEA-like helix-hairpin-helix protein